MASYDTATPPTSTIVLETPTPLVGAIGTISLQPYSAPVATAQSVTVGYSVSQNITLAGTDSNNATLSFAIATQPAHGTLSGTWGEPGFYTRWQHVLWRGQLYVYGE